MAKTVSDSLENKCFPINSAAASFRQSVCVSKLDDDGNTANKSFMVFCKQIDRPGLCIICEYIDKRLYPRSDLS